MRSLALAALFCACLAAPAAAHIRQYHHWRHASAPVHRLRVGARRGRFARPLRINAAVRTSVSVSPLVRIALPYVGARKFTRYPGPWCRDAVNVWLLEAGYRTDASRMALEALYLGPHLSRPKPGALGVMRRRGGGHVVVVVRQIGRLVEAVSPNFRGRVALVAYPLRRFLAFVAPLRG